MVLRYRRTTWFLLRYNGTVCWDFAFHSLYPLILSSSSVCLCLLLLKGSISGTSTNEFTCNLRRRIFALLCWLCLILNCINKFLAILSFIFVGVIEKIISLHSIGSHRTPWLWRLLPDLWLTCSVICPHNVALGDQPFNLWIPEAIKIRVCQSLKSRYSFSRLHFKHGFHEKKRFFRKLSHISSFECFWLINWIWELKADKPWVCSKFFKLSRSNRSKNLNEWRANSYFLNAEKLVYLRLSWKKRFSIS